MKLLLISYSSSREALLSLELKDSHSDSQLSTNPSPVLEQSDRELADQIANRNVIKMVVSLCEKSKICR